MLRMNLRIMRVTFSHKKSQRIRSWRPMSNHPKSSIGCSDRLYENDRILSLPGRAGYELPPIPDRGQSFFTRKPERKWRSMKNRTKTRHRTFRTVGDYFHRQLWGRPKTNYRNTDRNVRCDTYNVVCFRRINLLYWPAKRNQIEILWEP